MRWAGCKSPRPHLSEGRGEGRICSRDFSLRRGGLLQCCLMRPCHRAVANTPPSGSPLKSVATRHAAFTQLREVRPLGATFFETTLRLLFVTAR